MNFRSGFSAVLAGMIIGIYFLLAHARVNNSKGSQIIADMCRESLYGLLSDIPSIKKWPPTIQLRVEVDDADVPSVKVSMRAIPDAYYDPDRDGSAWLTAALAILDKKEWSPVASGIKCVPPYDEKSFGAGTIPLIAGELGFFSLTRSFTGFIYKFTEKFNFYFNSEDMRLARKPMRGKLLSHAEMFGEKYTNSTFDEIRISVYFYALIWDPKQTIQPKVKEDLFKGVMDPQKQFSFSANIRVAGKTSEEIEQEIDAAAKKAAEAGIGYLREASGQIEK